MWLRDLIFRDFWLKVFSLTLAVLIWVVVSFAIRKEGAPAGDLFLNSEPRVLRVEVHKVSSAADVRAFQVDPSEVMVTVRGEKRALERLRDTDIHAIVNLSDIESTPGPRKRIEITTPPGIVHVRVDPESVRVQLPAAGLQAAP
jgi:hypothetical protein